MGFLDNSGDIILDAVLTDHGRKVMAKGDGSFQITKFAVCDEEIDYSLYNSSHGSGSAYYDLEILQTPILEAFTNNTSTMNTRLVTIPRTDLLYMPILRLNEASTTTAMHASGTFMVAVDRNTENNSYIGADTSVGTYENQAIYTKEMEKFYNEIFHIVLNDKNLSLVIKLYNSGISSGLSCKSASMVMITSP